jgi:hypothetical protein
MAQSNLGRKWFQFTDGNTQGYRKSQYHYVFIRTFNMAAARAIFQEALGLDPTHRTCHCCGPDFGEYEWGFCRPPEDYFDLDAEDILVIN